MNNECGERLCTDLTTDEEWRGHLLDFKMTKDENSHDKPELLYEESTSESVVVQCINSKNDVVYIYDHIGQANIMFKLIWMHIICFVFQLAAMLLEKNCKQQHGHNLLTMFTVPVYQMVILIAYNEVF